MRRPQSRHRVGSLRPSQFLFSNGIGSVVDLPAISAVIMGIDAWDEQQCAPIDEPRLLAALQRAFGLQVENLRGLPHAPDEFDPVAGPDASIGAPVEPFPGWLVCPLCRMLLPVDSGLFEIKANAYRPERTHYEHKN